MLINSKLPSIDIKLGMDFFPSEIISLLMKNIGNLKKYISEVALVVCYLTVSKKCCLA